ncbi:MEI2-like protein 5 [Actinidia rufa]|uniref:MEI2-like protein 5 n=1 Tax=Actinidia rufa TaxID=165716 RepID=A0A7J0G631_9ERIC|nr:MEI2-like protein 5 [Actinidia rufa]
MLNSARVAPIGNGRAGQVEHKFSNTNTNLGTAFQQSHSLPEPKLNQYSGTMPSFGASSSNGSGIETLSGPQFLWGSPSLYPEKTNSSTRRTPSVEHPFTSNGQSHGLPYAARHGSFVSSSHHHPHHHVGSAPSGVPFERHLGFLQEFSRNIIQNMSENGSPGFSMISSPRLSPVFLGNGHYPGLIPTSMEGFERWWGRRVENNGNQIDSKKQFQLDLDKIKSGEDTRTTLMIKNIPNKYTSKMLLAAIDENNRGTYDFLYLPIDFKNKCNVGYAFINMLSPLHIIPFYEAFNGKKWEKFNSEKVASLAFARIQGKAALVTHFQNSSLMNEDKRCRPILFHSDGLEADHPGTPSLECLNVPVRQSYRPNTEDSPDSPLKGSPDEKLLL